MPIVANKHTCAEYTHTQLRSNAKNQKPSIKSTVFSRQSSGHVRVCVCVWAKLFDKLV